MGKATPSELLRIRKSPPPPSRGRAKALRQNLTEAEQKMWYELREFKKLGFHFRKQAPIGNYIVDFVCLKHRLIIELDGGHHTKDDQHTHDLKRDTWLTSEGFRVLRFWNEEFFKNRHGVLDTILNALPLEGGGGCEAVGGGKTPRIRKETKS